MRSRLLVAIGVLVCVLTIHTGAQQQFQLFASVVDGTGSPVTTIQPGDVRVTENGAEAKVLAVEPIGWPTKVQILVDNGLGLGSNNLNQLRTGVRGLIEALPEGTDVTLVGTSPQPRFILRPSTDRQAQLKAVDQIAPDSNVGRFVESLNEAMQRFERDKASFFPVIVTFGTTLGDTRVMERDVNQLMERLEKRPTTVHVVLLTASGQSASGGAMQTAVGLNVTQYTKGRYENIAASSRIASLLPEIGAQVAKSHERQSKQVRITAERPSGSSGNIGKVSMQAKGGLTTVALSFDGRMP
jgi:hypothetical protein